MPPSLLKRYCCWGARSLICVSLGFPSCSKSSYYKETQINDLAPQYNQEFPPRNDRVIIWRHKFATSLAIICNPLRAAFATRRRARNVLCLSLTFFTREQTRKERALSLSDFLYAPTPRCSPRNGSASRRSHAPRRSCFSGCARYPSSCTSLGGWGARWAPWTLTL